MNTIWALISMGALFTGMGCGVGMQPNYVNDNYVLITCGLGIVFLIITVILLLKQKRNKTIKNK